MNGPPPCNWLAAQRADFTFDTTPVCIFVTNFRQEALLFTNLNNFCSPRAPPVPYWLGLGALLLAPWFVVLFCLTTATAPGSRSVDSCCEATVTQVVNDNQHPYSLSVQYKSLTLFKMISNFYFRPGPEVKKKISCLAELRTKIMLIKVKMPTLSIIITTS